MADRWVAGFTEVRDEAALPGGTVWEGNAADALQARTTGDVTTIIAPANQLHAAAGIAERGYDQLTVHRDGVLEAVVDAERDGFNVSDTYGVTDTRTSHTDAELAERQKAATGHTNFIRHRVMGLVDADREIATKLDTATAGLEGFTFGEEPDGNAQLVDHNFKQGPGLEGPPRDDIIAEATDLAGNRVVLRRGFWDPMSPDDGWGWDKVSGKHGITNVNVFRDLVSHSAPVERQGNSLVYEVPIERTETIRHQFGPFHWYEYRRTGEIVTIKIGLY